MSIHHSVTALLQVLDLTFSIILVLLIGLGLPGRKQIFLDSFGDFNLGLIEN